MQWSPAAVLALAVLLVAGGMVNPVAATPAIERPSVGPTVTGGGETVDSADDGPPDPDADGLGWEAGYWHNESIDVNQSDGINGTELNATVARSMARVERVRQLEFLEPVPVEIETRESFRAQQANQTTDPELAAFDNAKFEALLLVGEDRDSIAVQNENAGSAILGFYSPTRKAIVVISENPSDLQLEELTLAHELVHALQDQHFNLSRYDARTRDGANAQSGLIEGDAKLVELRYQRQCDDGGAWNDTCVAPAASFATGSGGGLANIGTYLVKYQPYSDGPRFITSLYDAGGWAAVDAAYERPPASTEQVIHPERYPNEQPTEVALDDRTAAGWERVRPPNRPDYGTVGEAALTAMLVYPLYHSDGRTRIISPNDWLNRTDDGSLSTFDPLRYENRYVTGWDGDRLHVYRNDDNETAYVWRLAWDSPGDAREFLEGYHQVLAYWGAERVAPDTWVVDEGEFADAFHVSVEGRTVTIVNAPTVEQLPEVRRGVEVTPTPTPTPFPTVVHTLSPTPTSPDNASPSPADATATATPGQAGFGPLAALAAVLVGALAGRRG